MKLVNYFSASVLVLSLTACGNAKDNALAEAGQAEMPMADTAAAAAMAAMDHSNPDMSNTTDDIGHGTGVIRSISSQGDFLTINHGPLEGIAMGAMTMGFDIMGDVDLSDFAKGDEIAFMVKRGRDGSYRVMAICNTVTHGTDCLDAMMNY